MKIRDFTGEYSVYVHITPNGKLYFGITHMKPEHRWLSTGKGYQRCTLFWRAIQKYGWDNIQHIILINNLSKEVACECEKYLIVKYKSNQAEFGYNNSLGGESGSFGYVFTTEQRIKLSNSLKGRVVSEETRRKIGQANSIALKGRTVSQEVRDKISKHNAKAFSGKRHTEEAKRKNSLAHIGKQYHLGYKHSDETKRKMSEAKKGKPLSEKQKAQLERLHNKNKGSKRTPEQIERMRQVYQSRRKSLETCNDI